MTRVTIPMLFLFREKGFMSNIQLTGYWENNKTSPDFWPQMKIMILYLELFTKYLLLHKMLL